MTTPITIAGRNFRGIGFDGPSSIRIAPTNGPTNVTDIVVTPTSITCKAPNKDPSWPEHVGLWITTPLGVVHKAAFFRYRPPPTLQIHHITPTSGHYLGGTQVTIAGEKFTNAVQVLWDIFGSETPAMFVVDSDFQIRATSPGGIPYAPYGIKVRLANGQIVSYRVNNAAHPAWRYTGDPVIEVDYITPAAGSSKGGYLCTVKGRGFINVGMGLTDISYQALSSVVFAVVNDETATFTVPNTQSVFCDTGPGTAIFFYQNNGAPTSTSKPFEFQRLKLTGTLPTQTSRNGGEVITLIGESVDSITEIHIIDDNLITNVNVFASMVVVDGNRVTFVMPTINPGSYNTLRIKVVGWDPTGFSYVEGGGDPADLPYVANYETTIEVLPGSTPPAPTAITPTNGTHLGGTHVVVTVANSTSITAIKIDGVVCTGFAIDDATHVSGTAPAHVATTPLAVSVRVSNVFGNSPALLAAYIYN